MAVPMLVLWFSVALAGPEERIVRLREKDDWDKLHAVCTKAGMAEAGTRDLRAMCAEGAWRAAKPADEPGAMKQFATTWSGTDRGRRALERSAELALPPKGASEAELMRHHRAYAETEAGTVSLLRAEGVGFETAVKTATLARWRRFLDTYPNGRLHDKAVAETLAVGVTEASATPDGSGWRALLTAIPGAEPQIRTAGDAWVAKQVAAQLVGPGWTEAVPTLPLAHKLDLAVPQVPWSSPIAARWVALKPDGTPIPDAELADGLALSPTEARALTHIRPGLGILTWTAPVGWAQPPRDLGVTWALEVTVGAGTPVRTPYRGTAHWQTGAAGEALVHFSSQGLWVHGPTGSVQWSTEAAPRGAATLVKAGSHLFFSAGKRLLVVPVTGGIPELLLDGHRTLVLSTAGDRVWVRHGDTLWICSESVCEDTGAKGWVDLSPANDRYLMRDKTDDGDIWTVHSGDGRILASTRTPATDADYNGVVAAFDRTGDRVLVGVEVDDSHFYREIDTRTGAIVAEKRCPLKGSGYGEKVHEQLIRFTPVERPGEWTIFTEGMYAAQPRFVAVRSLSGGQFHLVGLADETDAAWYRRTGEVPETKPPTGWAASGKVVGRTYRVSLSGPGSPPRVVQTDPIPDCGAARPGDLDPGTIWLPGGRWVALRPALGSCRGPEKSVPIYGASRLVPVAGGTVRPAPDPDDLIDTLSPDLQGFVSETWKVPKSGPYIAQDFAVLPSGRVIDLQARGAFVWMTAPLSLRLQVEADGAR